MFFSIINFQEQHLYYRQYLLLSTAIVLNEMYAIACYTMIHIPRVKGQEGC